MEDGDACRTDSLLGFRLDLGARSGLLLGPEPFHVPAHAFVQASADVCQVRHRLPVAERGQPQVAHLSLAEAEGRHAGNGSASGECSTVSDDKNKPKA